MKRSVSNLQRRGVSPAVVLTTVLLSLLSAAPASAQRFLNVYGAPGATDDQRGGVVQTANGEYVTCGSTDFVTGKPDAYVIRTDPAGLTLWDNVYPINISFNSVATNVKECVGGDLIVVGKVQTSNVCPGCEDAFVMRLDAAGNVLWAYVYGTPGVDEVATDVVEAAYGNKSTTFAGDFIVSGVSDVGGPNGKDGYMFRIPGGGGPTIWENTYDVSGLDDELRGLDEMDLNFPGDVIATGYTFRFNIPGTEDVWGLRVDGNTGATITSAEYGIDMGDAGNSIQELKSGVWAGRAAIAGTTWNGADALLLVIDPTVAGAVCMPSVGWTAFGDGTQAPDTANSVREITSAAVGTPGDMVVVGTTSLAPLGGATDAFLQQYAQGTLAPVGAFNVYGGNGADQGEEVAEAPNSLAGFTFGFAVAGLTYSPSIIPPGAFSEIYLIKTNTAGGMSCNSGTATPTYPATGLVEQCVSVTDNPFATGTFNPVLGIPATAGSQLCYLNPKPAVDPDAAHGATLTFDGSAASRRLATYPNPVPRNGTLSTAFELDPDRATTVVVSDLLGREVARRTAPSGTGRTVAEISTAGWPAGTYVVTVGDGGSRAAARVVVGDR